MKVTKALKMTLGHGVKLELNIGEEWHKADGDWSLSYGTDDETDGLVDCDGLVINGLEIHTIAFDVKAEDVGQPEVAPSEITLFHQNGADMFKVVANMESDGGYETEIWAVQV